MKDNLPKSQIDLHKVSIFKLICMIERGDKDVGYLMMSIKSAEARKIERSRVVKYPFPID